MKKKMTQLFEQIFLNAVTNVITIIMNTTKALIGRVYIEAAIVTATATAAATPNTVHACSHTITRTRRDYAP